MKLISRSIQQLSKMLGLALAYTETKRHLRSTVVGTHTHRKRRNRILSSYVDVSTSSHFFAVTSQFSARCHSSVIPLRMTSALVSF